MTPVLSDSQVTVQHVLIIFYLQNYTVARFGEVVMMEMITLCGSQVMGQELLDLKLPSGNPGLFLLSL